MTTTSSVLLPLVIQALTLTPKTTIAGANVWRRRTWPTQPDQYPCIILRWRGESKRSAGRSGVNYTTSTRLVINARVQVSAAEDDAGASEAEDLLLLLQRQIEVAVINYTPLMALLQQQGPSIDIEADVSSNGGEHLGELAMSIGLEFYQGAEDFYQPPQTPLTEVTLQTPFPTASGKGVGLDITFPPETS